MFLFLKFQGLFMDGDSSTFLFNLCHRFKMATESKYLALELFDSFMLQHIEDLYNHVLKSGSKVSKMKKDWLAIQERIKSQIHLRMVSCCQIASKVTSHYRIVSVHKAKQFLIDAGYRYTSNSILQSELRILKTLNYQTSVPSVLTYVETILEVLGHNEPGTEVKVYHSVALKVLDIVYMRYKEIYKRLLQVTTQQHTPSSDMRKKFTAVQLDKMLLSVCVITASVYITDQLSADKVIEQLNIITQVPCEDILDLATVIIELVMENFVSFSSTKH
ncbi:hypothetical protein KUTeg_001360 [Tegillarca granosa]|uniref:Cyclin N-terminal domain-containing protein 1 n=1 Tax=Tegillarca granosa TaxID=220873 RepID=A0ABQ9FR70_TEGGR|nr:hypothetical protein KUTeg_001360 [Tegillarca granosa]